MFWEGMAEVEIDEFREEKGIWVPLALQDIKNHDDYSSRS